TKKVTFGVSAFCNFAQWGCLPCCTGVERFVVGGSRARFLFGKETKLLEHSGGRLPSCAGLPAQFSLRSQKQQPTSAREGGWLPVDGSYGRIMFAKANDSFSPTVPLNARPLETRTTWDS